jgi:hypothetical protein
VLPDSHASDQGLPFVTTRGDLGEASGALSRLFVVTGTHYEWVVNGFECLNDEIPDTISRATTDDEWRVLQRHWVQGKEERMDLKSKQYIELLEQELTSETAASRLHAAKKAFWFASQLENHSILGPQIVAALVALLVEADLTDQSSFAPELTETRCWCASCLWQLCLTRSGLRKMLAMSDTMRALLAAVPVIVDAYRQLCFRVHQQLAKASDDKGGETSASTKDVQEMWVMRSTLTSLAGVIGSAVVESHVDAAPMGASDPATWSALAALVQSEPAHETKRRVGAIMWGQEQVEEEVEQQHVKLALDAICHCIRWREHSGDMPAVRRTTPPTRKRTLRGGIGAVSVAGLVTVSSDVHPHTSVIDKLGRGAVSVLCRWCLRSPDLTRRLTALAILAGLGAGSRIPDEGEDFATHGGGVVTLAGGTEGTTYPALSSQLLLRTLLYQLATATAVRLGRDPDSTSANDLRALRDDKNCPGSVDRSMYRWEPPGGKGLQGGEYNWAKVRPSCKEGEMYDRFMSDEECQLLLHSNATANGGVHTPPQVAVSISTFALAALHGTLLATVADTRERQGTVVGLQLVRELMELLIGKGSRGGGKAVPYAAAVLALMVFLDLPVLPLPPPPPPVVKPDDEGDGSKSKNKKKKAKPTEEEAEKAKKEEKAEKRAADRAKKRAREIHVHDYQPLTMRRALLKQTDLLLPFLRALLDPQKPMASQVRQSGIAIMSSLVQPEEGLGAHVWRERLAVKMSEEYERVQEVEQQLVKEQGAEKEREALKQVQALKKLELKMGTAAFNEMQAKQRAVAGGEEGGGEEQDSDDELDRKRRWRRWGRVWEGRWAELEQSLRRQRLDRIDELCAYGVHEQILQLCATRAGEKAHKMPFQVQRRAMAVMMVMACHMPAVRANFTVKHATLLVQLLPLVDARVLPYVCVSVWALARLPRLRVVLGREKCMHSLLHWVSLIHSAYIGRGVASLLGTGGGKASSVPRAGVRFAADEPSEKEKQEIAEAEAKAKEEKEEERKKEERKKEERKKDMSGGNVEGKGSDEKEGAKTEGDEKKIPQPRRMSVVERERAVQAVQQDKQRRSDATHLAQLIKMYMRRDPAADLYTTADGTVPEGGANDGRRRLLELLRWVLGAVWMMSVDSATRMQMASEPITEVGNARSTVSQLLLRTVAQLLHQHVVQAGRAAGYSSSSSPQLLLHTSLDVVDIKLEGGTKVDPGAYRLCKEGWGCVFFAMQALRTLCTTGAAKAAGEKFSVIATPAQKAADGGRRPSLVSAAMAGAMVANAGIHAGGQEIDIAAERLAVQAVTGHGLLSLLGQLAVMDINEHMIEGPKEMGSSSNLAPPALTIASAQYREMLMRQGALRHAATKKEEEISAKKKAEQVAEMEAVHKVAELEAKKLEEEEEKELRAQGKGTKKKLERKPLYTSPHDLARQKLAAKDKSARKGSVSEAASHTSDVAASPTKAVAAKGVAKGGKAKGGKDDEAAKAVAKSAAEAAEKGKHRNERVRQEVKSRFRRFSKLVVADVRVQALTPEQRRHAGLMDLMLRKQHEAEGETSVEKQMLLMLCHSDASCAACAAECLAELARNSKRKRQSIADLGGIAVLLAIAAQAEECWLRWADTEAARSWRRKNWTLQRQQKRQWLQEQTGQVVVQPTAAELAADELDFELEDEAHEHGRQQQEEAGMRQPSRADKGADARGKSIVLCAVMQTLAELAKSVDLQVHICRDGLDLLLRCSKLGPGNWETTVGAMTTLRLLSTNKHNRTQLYKAELRASATAIVQQSAAVEHEQAPQGAGSVTAQASAGYVQLPSPAATLSVPILKLGAQKDPMHEAVPSLSVQDDMALQHKKQRRREEQQQRLRRRLALLQDLDGSDSSASDAALNSLQAMAAGDGGVRSSGGAKGDWGEYVDGHFTSVATPRSSTFHFIEKGQTLQGEREVREGGLTHKHGVRSVNDRGLYSTLLAAPTSPEGTGGLSKEAPVNLQQFFTLPSIGGQTSGGSTPSMPKSSPRGRTSPRTSPRLLLVDDEEEEEQKKEERALEQKGTYPLTASMAGFDCTDLTKQDFDSIVDELRRTRCLWSDKKISTISRDQLLPARPCISQDNDLSVRNLPRVRAPALRPNQVASLQKRLNGELRRQARFLWEEAFKNDAMIERQRKGRDRGATFDTAYQHQTKYGDGLIGILGGEMADGQVELFVPGATGMAATTGPGALGAAVRLMPSNSHLNEANVQFSSDVDNTKAIRLPMLYGAGVPRAPADGDSASAGTNVQYRNDLYTHVMLKNGKVACMPRDHTTKPSTSALQADVLSATTPSVDTEASTFPPGLGDLPLSLNMPGAVHLPSLLLPATLFDCMPSKNWQFEGTGTAEELRRKAATYRRFDFSSLEGLIVVEEKKEEAVGDDNDDDEGVSGEGRSPPPPSEAVAAGDNDGDHDSTDDGTTAEGVPANRSTAGPCELVGVIARGVAVGRLGQGNSSGWGVCVECSTSTSSAPVMGGPALPPPLLPWELSPLSNTPIRKPAPTWNKPSTTPAGWSFTEQAGMAAAKEEDGRFVRVEHLMMMPGILPDKLLTFRIIGYKSEGELQVPPPIVKFTPMVWPVDANTPKMPSYTNWPPYRGGQLALFSDAGGRIEYQLLYNGVRVLSDDEQAKKVANMFSSSNDDELRNSKRKTGKSAKKRNSLVGKSKSAKRKTAVAKKTNASDMLSKVKKARKTIGARRNSLKMLAGEMLGAIHEGHVSEPTSEWTVYEKPIDLVNIGSFNVRARVIKQFHSKPEPVTSMVCEPTVVKITKEPWSLYISVFMTRQHESETHEFTGSRAVIRRMFHQDLENCWSKISFRHWMVGMMGLGDDAMSFADVNNVHEFHELRGSLFEGYDNMLSLFDYYCAMGGHPQLQVTLETFKKMVVDLGVPDHFGASKEVLAIMFRASNIIERTEEQAMKVANMSGGAGKRKGSVLEMAGLNSTVDSRRLERKGSVMNDDVALMRFEFVELVIRLACVKYLDLQEPGAKAKIEGASPYCAEAMKMMVRTHLQPKLVEPRYSKDTQSNGQVCMQYGVPPALLPPILSPPSTSFPSLLSPCPHPPSSFVTGATRPRGPQFGSIQADAHVQAQGRPSVQGACPLRGGVVHPLLHRPPAGGRGGRGRDGRQQTSKLTGKQ